VSFETDVVVLGSGAAGLTAALAASVGGADVVVLERAPLLGGTAALSGGGLWLPGTALQEEAGLDDTASEARTYLGELTQGRVAGDVLDAFVSAAPELVELYRAHTPLQLYLDLERPDYQSELPGARPFGRLVGVGTYDMSRLPEEYAELVRRPVWPGGTEPILWTEMREFLEAGDPWGWVPLAQQRIAANVVARGCAFVAGMVEACLEQGVTFVTDARAATLVIENGAVRGVDLVHAGHKETYRVNAGVMLAAGGFERNRIMWNELVGRPLDEPLSPRDGNQGDGLRMAAAAGARMALLDEVWWSALGGGAPGAIAVNRDGRRFLNECLNYHDYGEVVTRFDRSSYEFPNYPAFVISDHPPGRAFEAGPDALEHDIAAGRVVKADTLEGLAHLLDIDGHGLAQQVEEFNVHAAEGLDPQFGRGSSRYDRWRKFDKSLANPALRPLRAGPYYGERLSVRCFGTKGGAVIDEHAQVVDFGNAPIPGLYASGNVAASVFGVAYPGGGATLGQAAVFGMIAGRELAAVTPRPIADRR
jgi:succinate dehydrogenase/fumarate reductase flavoprotein subunit